MVQLGRNDKCWCNSEKKYKHCHLGTSADEQRTRMVNALGEFGAQSLQQSLAKTFEEKRSGVAIKKIDIRAFIEKFRSDRAAGTRPKPSQKLILGKSVINDEMRGKLIDIAGELVDQNWCGRSEMCVLFAILIGDALRKLGKNPSVIIGNATYTSFSDTTNNFTWNHAWVRLGEEIIDCNVDSMIENPMVPEGIAPENFWGLSEELPKDRKFVVDKIIDEPWIKENTTYDELQKWRGQLYEILEKRNQRD